MAHLLYFADGPLKLTHEQVRGTGLDYPFPDGGFACGDFTGRGPGGEQGCVMTAGDRCGYYPDKQHWLRIPDATFPGKSQFKIAGLHVGYWREARPTPAELQVARPLRGRAVRLRDEQEWLVPIARAWSDAEGNAGWYNALPGVLRLDADGQWASGGVDHRYARLWDIACAWWDGIRQQVPDHEGAIRFDFSGAHDAAVEVLATNYRIRRAEAALLGLFDDQFYAATEILNTLVDLPTYLAWAKKNMTADRPAGSSTSAGEPAAIPATDRH